MGYEDAQSRSAGELVWLSNILNELHYLKRQYDWQPIETAPRDGTRILVLACGNVHICHWGMPEPHFVERGSENRWVTDSTGQWDHRDSIRNVTHWMSLPEPPK